LALSGGRLGDWRRVTGALSEDRFAIVEAVESRCPERAAEAVDAHAAHAADLILSIPRVKKTQIADPAYVQLLASLLNVRLSSAAS